MFSGLDLDMKYLSGYDSMKVFTGNISTEADISSIDSSLEIIRADETIIVFCPNDKVDSTERSLLDLGFRSIDAPQIEGDPSSVESKIKSQLSQFRNERDSIDHEIEALAKRHGDWLVSCEEHYSALSEKSSLPLKLATTENMFVMDGWVPSKSVSILQQELQKLDVYYELGYEGIRKEEQESTILGAMEVNYHHQATHPIKLEIGHRISRVGGKSFDFIAGIFQKGQDSPICTALFKMVAFNYYQNQAIPVPKKIKELCRPMVL